MNARSEVIQVIKTVYITGEGTKNDPIRQVIAYFDFDGTLICKKDNYTETTTVNPLNLKD